MVSAHLLDSSTGSPPPKKNASGIRKSKVRERRRSREGRNSAFRRSASLDAANTHRVRDVADARGGEDDDDVFTGELGSTRDFDGDLARGSARRPDEADRAPKKTSGCRSRWEGATAGVFLSRKNGLSLRIRPRETNPKRAEQNDERERERERV